MQKTNRIKEQLEQDILNLINSCRGRVLDIVEAQIGSSSNWRIIRGQLLNLFGEKGLSGDVQRSLVDAFEQSRRHE